MCRRTDSKHPRLAAIHSFFQFLAFEKPTHSEQIQQVLAIPTKRHTRRPVSFLTQPEIDALLAAPDSKTWIGRRDRTLLLVAVQTGLRVSELLGLRCKDVALEQTGSHVQCTGKGRKHRCTPLRKDSVQALRAWLRERDGAPNEPLFPSVKGAPLGRDGVEYLLRKHLPAARSQCPSLKTKRVTAHTLRHSAAMEWLHEGVDRAVIARCSDTNPPRRLMCTSTQA